MHDGNYYKLDGRSHLIVLTSTRVTNYQKMHHQSHMLALLVQEKEESSRNRPLTMQGCADCDWASFARYAMGYV